MADGKEIPSWMDAKTINELLSKMRELEMKQALDGMSRSAWAEARHTIRYVKEDLSALHTRLESAPDGWETDIVLELAGAIGRLIALSNYISNRAEGR